MTRLKNYIELPALRCHVTLWAALCGQHMEQSIITTCDFTCSSLTISSLGFKIFCLSKRKTKRLCSTEAKYYEVIQGPRAIWTIGHSLVETEAVSHLISCYISWSLEDKRVGPGCGGGQSGSINRGTE